MTEKRFTIADYPTDIVDNQTGKKYPCSSYGTHMHGICDLLNHLHEENEQLKQRITTQSVDREQLCKRIDEVRKENEQLQHDATVLIQSNRDYRKENESLKEWKKEQVEQYLRLKNVCNTVKRENEQLKKDVKYFYETYSVQEYGLDIETHVQLSSPILSRKELLKENEQLKQLVNIADDLIDKLGSETMQNEWIKNF